MNKKWRSSQKVSVDGSAFSRARLAFKNQSGELKRGEYGYGSQEWLAEQAKVSPRTINTLETGQATLKTVDSVSKVLNVKGREFIQGYGADFTNFRATDVIDFRPIISGRLPGNEKAYLDAPFLLTLSPLVINVDDDFIDTSILKRMHLVLSVGDMKLDFKWLYNVSLTSRASTWLGDEEDVSEVVIHTGEAAQKSVMFRQDSSAPVSWKQFIDYIAATEDARILLTLTLVFEYFEKQGHIMVSVGELKGLFKSSYPPGQPFWIQPNAIMV